MHLWSSTRAAAVVALAIMALASCGGGDGTAEPAASTETVTHTETVTETVTATPESRSAGEQGSTGGGATSGTDASGEGPEALEPTAVKDRTLTLADAFRASAYPEWVDDRFDIASKPEVQGIAVETDDCYRDDSPEVEFRLANAFSTFSLSAGQANESESSEQVAKVEVIGNGEQIDVRSVPFNEIVEFKDLNVQGVNALKVKVYLDDDHENCGDGSTTVVLHEIQLQ